MMVINQGMNLFVETVGLVFIQIINIENVVPANVADNQKVDIKYRIRLAARTSDFLSLNRSSSLLCDTKQEGEEPGSNPVRDTRT